jgi:hypothetical protein
MGGLLLMIPSPPPLLVIFGLFLLFSRNSLEFVSLNGFNSTICRYAAMLALSLCAAPQVAIESFRVAVTYHREVS